ncbi:MAG: rhodanese-like domain-containing protein [candidate division KSB1 bacterium]|nr:rhodanese-like domain-containing protein [candidate division KSB1 bacterium]
MWPLVVWMQRCISGVIILILVAVLPVCANPQRYPQFAQHQVDPAIPITFVSVEQVKQRLDAGRPQVLVDVRSWDEYAAGHLPTAVSIPLGVLPVRMAEIPRHIPVVLY